MIDVSSKVAVVTGAAAGMGLAAAESFVRNGGSVVLADIQEERIAQAAQTLGAAAVAIRCDVTCEADIKAAVSLAEARFGRLDVMFNNAGIGVAPHSVDTVSDEVWDLGMTLLLKSVMWGIRHAVPAMRRSGGGSIINTGSLAGVRSGYGTTAYSVAKAGVSQLSRLAASELAADNIRVNTILPGLIATSIFGAMSGCDAVTSVRMAHAVEEEFGRFQPIGRAGLPADIAQAFLFLASDASSFVTGIEVAVDGGMLLAGPPELAPHSSRPLSTVLEDAAERASHEP